MSQLALTLVFLLQTPAQQPAQPQPPQPLREIADPGAIATNQRVTPAGVQSVFTDRVFGVRFGGGGEVWVSIHGAVYRLSWQDNGVRGSAAFDGRAGVQGVAIDPVSGRTLVTSVGRLPAALAVSRTPGSEQLARTKSVAQLTAYDSAGVAPHWSSEGLGDYIAGSPAVARRPNASGHRVAVVPLPANDALAILDADSGTLLKTVPLGVLPVAAVVNANGSVAYVTNLGGKKPGPGDRAAKQCCDPFAEVVRVDARGLAQPGSVTRVDLVAGTVTKIIPVGRHPTGIAWDETGARLYVANGNSDAVSVIDTRRDVVSATIAITPFRQRNIGLAPTAVALAPDYGTLYVTLGGANAVAVYSLPGARLRGLIPTGWYPTSIDVSADGHTIAVGSLFGVGSGNGRVSGLTGRYVHSYRGSVNVIAVPSDAALAAYTTSVAQNNRLTLRTDSAGPAIAVRPHVAARAVPERPGEPSLIDHVVYIIRENRTYDQVLGDIGKGASDSSFTQYGRDVTPNTHALAERYVLLDHFFASGGNSADGHNWLTQGTETEYPMWPLYTGRSYPSEGIDPLAYSSGGFIWEGVRAKGKSVAVFGEYAPSPQWDSTEIRTRVLAQYRDSHPAAAAIRAMMGKLYQTRSDITSLDRVLVRDYPGWTMTVPDVAKADVILEYLRGWEARHAMPNLVIITLPSDHTNGTSPGWCTPKACNADNDLALGRIVEGFSHSPFWKSMAILAVEDDAQNGVDHIDGHRTVAVVASPYAKRGSIDPTFYSQPSMVKTIELMLGLPALSMFDLVATDMRTSFIGPDEQPNFEPYTAVEPKQSLYEVNQQVGAITGPHAAERRRAARESARMNFSEPDAAPSELLNRILWHDARGWDVPYPAVKQSVFLPMSVDLTDEEREKPRR
ncbi:MAG TPA: bifunctional YncE family protein/alkaline phosphatase family protein [Gemmatimonadales bacterium]|nr:bifunctional YncE family protein/alkaline phosphatase family protein [Gemmatimonadales bacterium]